MPIDGLRRSTLAIPAGASPPLRPARESVVPDLVLGLAVAAVALIPATFGASLLLAPPAWIWAELEIRRRRRRGEWSGERLDSARTCGGILTVAVGGPLLVAFLGYLLLKGLAAAGV